jgi:hypothetical protein
VSARKQIISFWIPSHAWINENTVVEQKVKEVLDGLIFILPLTDIKPCAVKLSSNIATQTIILSQNILVSLPRWRRY